ncbi:MAG: NAD/NADP octopine/nopaline dehydrogenase family protein [Anaerolineae bacterium]|nr:NAD/NADP octopine/nopaline dehydrogenase family protein [Anaerolineae bacterium]
MLKLTICGGGNAAHVLIGLASQAGWEVDVFAPLADEADRLRTGGGITVRQQHKTSVGQARCISPDPAEVIPGSKLILLALPAFAHDTTLRAIAPFLEPSVIVGALPARSGFDFAAHSILAERDLTLFGLQTLPWACRIITYGQAVEILGTKEVVNLAARPPTLAPRLAKELAALFNVPLQPVRSFLTLTLANPGQLIHPGIMYGLCQGREAIRFTQDDISLFYQGVDPFTAGLLQAMSTEVQTLARALAAHLPNFDPLEVIPLYTWLIRSYATAIADKSSLQRAFTTNRAYAGLKLPTRAVGPNTFAVDYTTRYLAEDVPYGLVVTRGLAELAGVATPTIDEVIDWAQARLERSYLLNGRLAGPDLAETHAPQIYGIHNLERLAAVMGDQGALPA